MMLILIPVVVQAQPDTLWTRSIRNGSRPMEVIRTFDGGFAIGGSGWCGDEDRRDQDFSIIKTDSVGSIEWREFYTLIHDTTHSTEKAYAIEQLSDAGYVLSGRGAGGGGMIVRTDSTGEMLWSRFYDLGVWFYDSAITDDDNIVVASTNGWARKIDMEEGDIVWENSYSVENGGRFWNITSTTDGGFLLTGDISSIGEGSADMYAVKIDRDGEVEWYNTYGTEYSEVISYAVQTSDGGYCMVGGSHREQWYNYGMIVRTDENGEEIWMHIFAEDDILNFFDAVVETPDGGFAIESGITNDVYLSRVNSDGELIWSTEYYVGGGPLDSYSLILMEDFGYVLGGFSGVGDWLVRTEPDELSESAWNLQASDSSHHYADVPLDSTLTWELVLTNEGQQPVEVLSITVDSAAFSVEFDDILTLEPDEEASIAVTFTPADSLAYTGVLTIHTYWRDLVVELSGTGLWLSVPDEPNIIREFVLHGAYPNPFNSTTSISYTLDRDGLVTLKLYDLAGREVASLANEKQSAGNYQTVWNAEGKPSGMYLLRLNVDGRERVTKLILIR